MSETLVITVLTISILISSTGMGMASGIYAITTTASLQALRSVMASTMTAMRRRMRMILRGEGLVTRDKRGSVRLELSTASTGRLNVSAAVLLRMRLVMVLTMTAMAKWTTATLEVIATAIQERRGFVARGVPSVVKERSSAINF